MKKIIIILLALFESFIGKTQQQDLNYNIDSISDFSHFENIFEAPNKTKNEIFQSIITWISANYKSSNSVIDLNDKENGEIVVKGINEVNTIKVLGNIQRNDIYHSIKISVKDSKYRIILDYGNIINEATSGYRIGSSYVSGSPRSETSVNTAIKNYNKASKLILKKSLVEEYVNICNSIKYAVENSKKDNW